jgi:hypothetical protein
VSVNIAIIEQRRWEDALRRIISAQVTVENVRDYAVRYGRLSAGLLLHADKALEELAAIEALIQDHGAWS